MSTVPRWHANISYRTEAGVNVVEHDVEEIADLDPIIEHGPHWDTIARIEITLQRSVEGRPLTVEEAEQL